MRAALLIACAFLAGCASRPSWLENRVVCTLDRKEAHVLSKWGPVSIGAVLADADAAEACK